MGETPNANGRRPSTSATFRGHTDPEGRARGFGGVIGPTLADSIPWWPEPVRPPAGSPDVVIVVLDDVGFAQIGRYGSDIETPTMDRLASGGISYTQFHTTAICCPTRACLLTGRNHHSNGLGSLVEMAAGFPGYNALIPAENGFLSEMLRQHGYGTFAVGKWHLTPDDEMTMAGPFDRWPLRRGFDRFYGWLGGGCHQWHPGALVYDNHFIEPPSREGYHVTEDLTDHAIGFVRDSQVAAPDKPFFLYLAYGAGHAPHHVPQVYVERYRGRFDAGWDVAREETLARQKELGLFGPDLELPQPNPGVAAWNDLSADERRLYARMQETFAGFMTHTDEHLGRLVAFLDEIGRLNNTIFVLVSDNGASAEGGPGGAVNEYAEYNGVESSFEDNLAQIDRLGDATTWNHYPFGWAAVGNAPFRMWKRYIYQGGIADPCIIHWPAGIRARNELRTQYHHAIDIVPTILDALGIDAPSEIASVPQAEIEGVSMAYSFDQPDTPTRKRTQYYEMLGARAIWHDGWKAVTTHEPLSGVGNFEEDVWELYHVADDPTESRNLANQEPDILRRLIDMWWVEAGRYNVLPLDDRGWERFTDPRPRLAPPDDRVYFPGAAPVFQRAAVDTVNRSFTIQADVTMPEDGAEGVVLAHGSRFGGLSLYIKGGQLKYVYKVAGLPEQEVSGTLAITQGRTSLGLHFVNTGPHQGTVTLTVGGAEIAEGFIERTATIFPVDSGLTCGEDRGLTVTTDYAGPFRFTGTIHSVTVSTGPSRNADAQRVLEAVMGRQ